MNKKTFIEWMKQRDKKLVDWLNDDIDTSKMNKKDYVNYVQSKNSPTISIDTDRYPETLDNGRFERVILRNGKVVYYDRVDGQYYDKDNDMYIDNSEIQKWLSDGLI